MRPPPRHPAPRPRARRLRQQNPSRSARPFRPPATLITVTAARSSAGHHRGHPRHAGALIDPKIGAEVAGRVTAVAAPAGQGQARCRLPNWTPPDFAIQTRRWRRDRPPRSPGRPGRALRRTSAGPRRQGLHLAQWRRRQHWPSAMPCAPSWPPPRRGERHPQQSRPHTGRRLVDGIIETQIVSPGDYVKVGDPLFRLISNRPARPPALSRIRRRSHPRRPAGTPRACPTCRAGDRGHRRGRQAHHQRQQPGPRRPGAHVDNDGSLLSGGTVNAAIVTGHKSGGGDGAGTKRGAAPGRQVVYLIATARSVQRVVETGVQTDGRVEIVRGLSPGETVRRTVPASSPTAPRSTSAGCRQTPLPP